MTERSRRRLSTRLSNPQLSVGQPVDALARPPQGNPGTGGPVTLNQGGQPKGARHASRIGNPQRRPTGELDRPPRAPARCRSDRPGAPRSPQLAGGQGLVTGDRDRLLGDCRRRRANDSPDSHRLPNMTGPDNHDAGSDPHVTSRGREDARRP
jgi:hypothetical protein